MSETQPHAKSVLFGKNKVVVQELSLKNFAEVGKALSVIAGRTEIFEAFKSGDNEKQAGAMAKLLQLVPEDLARIVHLSTGLDPSLVLDHTPTEVLDLLTEIWKMNNLVSLFQKKVGGLLGMAPAGPAPKVANAPEAPLTPPRSASA